MKRLGKAVLGAGVAALAVGACFSDPTSDLRSGASRLRLSATFVVQNEGDTAQVDIQVLDDQGNAIAFTGPTFAPVDPAIAVMEPLPDSTLRTVPGNTLFKSILIGLTPGQTSIAVTAGGVTGTVVATVFPLAFNGTITATAAPGDVVTITAPAGVTFVATTTAVFDVGSGFYEAVAQTATTLQYRAGASGTGTFTVDGAVLAGTLSLAALTSTTNLAVTEPGEPANNGPAATANLTLPAAVGDSVVRFGSADDVDIDDFFTITPATGDSIEVVLYWPNSTADVDLLVTNAGATACISGCQGATGAATERHRARLVAATTYQIWVNMYATGGIPVPIGYRLVIIKRG